MAMAGNPEDDVALGQLSFAELNKSAFMKRGRILDATMRVILFCCAGVSVLVTTAIVYVLIAESWPFFRAVPLVDFLTDTQWTPVFADAHYGILPLLTATLWSSAIAIAQRQAGANDFDPSAQIGAEAPARQCAARLHGAT